MRISRFLALAPICAVLVGSVAYAQQPAPPLPGAPPAAAVHRAAPSRTTEAPTIDGVLDERAWQQATPIGDFVQAEPLRGCSRRPRRPKCGCCSRRRRSTSASSASTASRRDRHDRLAPRFGADRQDSFQMIFDTYHDRQNGFIFGTNARRHPVRRAGAQRGRNAARRPAGRLGGGNDERRRRRRERQLGRLVGREDARHRQRAGPPSSRFRCARCATARRRRSGA